MKIKIIILPLLAAMLIAGGCAKKPGEKASSGEEGPINTEIKPTALSAEVLPQLDMGNWKSLSKTAFTINYPPYLKLSDKSSGKTLNLAFTNAALSGKITNTEIKSHEKFVLPVSKVNITLDKQPGALEILDSGGDLERVVKVSVTSAKGENLYFEFIFPRSEQDPSQTLTMLETIRQMLNSMRFK